MAFLEIISTSITLFGIGKNVYDWITGHTVSSQLEQITSKLEKIDNHLYLLSKQEVWDTSKPEQQIIEDLRLIREAVLPIRRALNSEVVISRPIASPDRLKRYFPSNPEEILFDIGPLEGGDDPDRRHSDPTLVPVAFSKEGRGFKGFIKTGYLRDSLDCEYKPQTESLLQVTSLKGNKVIPIQSMIGTLVNSRYRIQRILGQGVKFTFYSARDIYLGPEVILGENIIPNTSVESQLKFREAALKLANTYNPEMPRVTDFGVVADRLFVVIQDRDGGDDLRRVVKFIESVL